MKHGVSAYTHGNCRCAICRKANTDAGRQRRIDRKNGVPPKITRGLKNNGLCTKCGIFPRVANGHQCRECTRKRKSDWDRANPEYLAARAKQRMELYRSDPEFRASVLANHRARYAVVKQARQKSRRISKYRITPEYHDSALKLQDGKCAICATPECQSRNFLAIDHDHKTGVARGFLCMKCNHGLGSFRDNPDFLLAAVDYLTAYQMQQAI